MLQWNQPVFAEHSETAALIRLSVPDFAERVRAAWLGQLVGNIYGLSYEFQFIAEPGPDDFPYGFGSSLERVREVNGAFSDDDTDIEYMYLLQMERHGPEPSYKQLAEAWTHHVRDKVWVANRQALNLMHAGWEPPLTGWRSLNPQWFQIDPQLVNEIWAMTAPGMVRYAVEKSAWAARITNDDFGIEPTMHYAAMYAAAFFEKDIRKLIDRGIAELPDGSRYAQAVEFAKQLHQRYPDDWQAARKAVAGRFYYGDGAQREGELSRGALAYNQHAWPAVDAVLNGVCGILALLYGNGDFQRTLDLASGFGFDADNQAATVSGLLGVMHGMSVIPEHLLFPILNAGWREPFNDRYVNVSRHDLPDARISDIASRLARQGEQVILANGGRRTQLGEDIYLEINIQAGFTPPLELPGTPRLLARIEVPFELRLASEPDRDGITLRLAAGTQPPGIELVNGSLRGKATQTGEYHFTIEASRGEERVSRDFTMSVFGDNLARSASHVLHDEAVSAQELALIRDGKLRGETFYSRKITDGPQRDVYGFRWSQPQRIDTLWLNTGLPEEWGGWFTSLDVQYLDEEERWQSVTGTHIEPEMNFDNTQWRKGSYIDHLIRFNPVESRAIRIVGAAGGIKQDARNGGGKSYFSALSELQVFGD